MDIEALKRLVNIEALVRETDEVVKDIVNTDPRPRSMGEMQVLWGASLDIILEELADPETMNVLRALAANF